MDVPMVGQEELGYVGAILQEHRSPSNPTFVPPKAVRQGDLAYCREVPLIEPFVHLFSQLIFNILTTFKDSESYYHNDGKHASRIKFLIPLRLPSRWVVSRAAGENKTFVKICSVCGFVPGATL